MGTAMVGRGRVARVLFLAALLAVAGLAGAAKKGDSHEKDDAPAAEDEDGEADFWGVDIQPGKKVKVPLKDEEDESVRISQVHDAHTLSPSQSKSRAPVYDRIDIL